MAPKAPSRSRGTTSRSKPATDETESGTAKKPRSTAATKRAAANVATNAALAHPMDEASLLHQLIPHWESYLQKRLEQQNSQDDTSNGSSILLTRSVAKILACVDESALARGVDAVSLNDSLNPTNDVSAEWNQCVRHFVDCAVSAVAGGAADQAVAVATALLELTMAAVVAMPSNESTKWTSLLDLISYVNKFASLASVETVRMVATTALGHLTQRLSDAPSNANDMEQMAPVWDALQQAILVRLTDTAVSVRGAAVACVFPPSHPTILSADPDWHQAVVWMLQHDSSPTNRALAATLLPVTWQSMDYLVHRVRDTKAVVRVAALAALHHAAIGNSSDTGKPSLQPHFMAEIINAGLTERCAATKEATRRLICTVWMKQVDYNPVTLLECLGVVSHTAAATMLIQMLHETAADPTVLDMDVATALQHGLSQASHFSMEPWVPKHTDTSDTDIHTEASSFPMEHLFYARTVVELTKSAREKEAHLSQLVPDIIVLCQVLEHVTTQLIRTLAADDDEVVDEEDKLIFICSELLHLATMNASNGSSMEEGSRRVFTAAMKTMLTNLVTPDDLVEGCAKALLQSEGRNIETQVLWMLHELQSNQNDELRDNATLRSLAIVTILLEANETVPSTTALDAYAACIVPLLTTETSAESQLALVREAAVTCLGHLGLVSDATTVRDVYQPLMVALATNDDERMELRMQAMMAWMDWSVVFALSDDSMSALVGTWMKKPDMGTVCIAAEMATKLLLVSVHRPGAESLPNGPAWLARLVWLFFETGPVEDDDDLDETRIGSPVRLQQILSLFFPAFVPGVSPLGRTALMESIAPLLSMATAKTKGRRKSPPIAKMLDYIVGTAHHGREQMREAADVDTVIPESSPSLLAAIQVATFVSEHGSDLSTTVRRTLCKMIGGTVVDDLNTELWEHLSLLKELIEELSGNVLEDDATCLRSLQLVAERLVDVEVEDDVESDDETDDELSQSLLQLSVNENTPVERSKEHTPRQSHVLVASN